MATLAGKDFLLKVGDGSAGVVAAIAASKVIADLTYTAVTAGAAGNSIQVQYSSGGTAGSEVVTVIGKNIDVKIAAGVSTATQVRTAVLASGPAAALVSVAITGTGSNAQAAPVALAALAGGKDATSAEVFTTLAGLRAASIHMNAEEIDVTNIGSNQWKEMLGSAGILSITISGNGMFNDDATQTTALNDFLAQTLKNYQIIDGTTGNVFQGKYKIKTLERQGDYKSAQTWQIALQSSGQITYTPHP